jgi:hypothetical protein
VVIELKTAIVDVNELMGTLDRKRRLAPRIAADRGWCASSVSTWLVVADSRTNRRRVADHRVLLTSSVPRDGRSFPGLFRQPERGPSSGIAFWPDLPGVKVGHQMAVRRRVTVARAPAGRQEHAQDRARGEGGSGRSACETAPAAVTLMGGKSD